ncbi:MAG: hypothetical protein BJ554DRAFT_6497 [Olpidium bornovanus]|uniref:Ion transport domain-containing protein n=1 Tax=Olpidium bornovanus TaxID=278681 RepID=A0A8H7ZXU7_9FUNG|nr:MAG: hypothetical protein BJ554DRAFT_6497 [Olpidium bornovanus]
MLCACACGKRGGGGRAARVRNVDFRSAPPAHISSVVLIRNYIFISDHRPGIRSPPPPTDLRRAELQSKENEYWTFFAFVSVVDKFSLCIFSIEIGLRWLDNFAGFWNEGWNVVDFVITILSAIPEILTLANGSSNARNLGTIAGEIRTLRVLRTIKMV